MPVVIARLAEEQIAPPLALAQLLNACRDPQELQRQLTSLARDKRQSRAHRAAAEAVRGLLRQHRAGVSQAAELLRRDCFPALAATTDADAGLVKVRDWFDWAAMRAPEASVALYSLGDPVLLNAATGEVVNRLREWGIVRSDRRVLEIGCGIGRFLSALAPEVAMVAGTDIAPGMLAQCRRRCAGAAAVQCDGTDLAMFADAAFDAILAIDVCPYFVHAGGGLLVRHFAEAARVLRSGGDFLIFNLSYRNDLALDRQEVATLAERHGFTIRRNGTHDLLLWDAPAFHLQKS